MPALRFSLLLLTFLLVSVDPKASFGLRLGHVAEAQMAFGGQISSIQVSGNQRFSDQVVVTQMGLSAGDSFDPTLLNEAVKTLLASGNFEDVTLSRRGDTLVVTVVEVLFISAVIFDGNSALSDEALAAGTATAASQRLSRPQLQQDVNDILAAYAGLGRYQARVVPLITNLGSGRVNVTFQIDEGQVTSVGSVNFVGNQAYSDNALRRVVSSKQYSVIRSLTGGDRFSEAVLFNDRRALENHYAERGYADFEVLSSQASLVSDQSGFVVTFAISEGPRYFFADRRVENAIPGLSTEDLTRVIRVREGSLYKASRVTAAVERVRNRAEDLGYGAAVVSADFVRRPESGEIDLIIRVEQGPSITVERIEVSGNLRTRDYVIRREMRLAEGDAFSRNRLQRSIQRVNQLGYFSSANIRTRQGSSPDQAIVTIEVEEASTGSLNFGGGTSSSGGTNLNLSYVERNFLGRGQRVSLTFNFGEEDQNLNFSFTEPWFRGREVSAGGDVFLSETQSSTLSFDQEEIGAAVRLGYALSDGWTQSWGYTYRQTEVFNVSSTSPAILDQAGETTRSTLRHSLRFNSIDSPLDPSEGALFEMNNEVTGVFLGGDVDTIKNTIRAVYYRPLGETFVLRLKGEAGHISSESDRPVPLVDRFYLGEDLVRGFSSIGPRTKTDDESIGSTTYYGATAELRFPFPGLGERGLDGRFFLDAGTAYDAGADYSLDFGSGATGISDADSLRYSVGFGLTWNSLVGPINLDWGYPQAAEDYDVQATTSFGIGIEL